MADAESTQVLERPQTEPEQCDEPGVAVVNVFFATSRALQVRRWEAKDEPFRGFGSPPGKF